MLLMNKIEPFKPQIGYNFDTFRSELMIIKWAHPHGYQSSMQEHKILCHEFKHKFLTDYNLSIIKLKVYK